MAALAEGGAKGFGVGLAREARRLEAGHRARLDIERLARRDCGICLAERGPEAAGIRFDPKGAELRAPRAGAGYRIGGNGRFYDLDGGVVDGVDAA